ncbi:MAG: biotin/lipoyl-binding protein [Candidatus Eisenbacteria sp.]|nr:biotin/lipoyl-binding protein [Candidatus Eisenbacteria bacterium]
MVNSFTLHLDGTAYEIEQQGRAILVNGKRFEPQVTGTTVTIGELKYAIELGEGRAFVDGIAHSCETQGLDERPGEEAAGSAAAGEGDLTAIMPGLIIKVLVSEGDTVTSGDVIVILEAMKMENEICTPIDGTVQAIAVRAGDAVQQNQLLAQIE